MAVAAVQQKPSRMSLASLVKGRQTKPIRVLLYGVEGVGKSTFGANAPAPIFLGAEDGTAHLDVSRFPMPESWKEVLDAVRVLTVEAHDFKTLVVDTLDWAEPLLWAHICARDNEKSIESYGYGKGYQAALDEWRIFLAAMERMREAKGMHVVLLAHSWIKPFKNPAGPDYDRYEMKLNAKAGGLLKEWSDVVLFANHDIGAAMDEKTKRFKGVSTSARLMFTTRTHAYDAKNRYDLPERMPLDWVTFHEAVQAHKPAEPAKLIEAIKANAEQISAEEKAKALEYLEKASGDAAKLAKVNAWVNGKINS